MTPDDPRHGTTAGELKHRRDGEKPCRPCADANAAYQRRSRAVYGARSFNLRDATGTRRRIGALFALGWSGTTIAKTSGLDQRFLWTTFTRQRVSEATAARVAYAYDILSMKIPPADDWGSRISVAKSRALAVRRGWAPPLAWDDIDNDEAPIGKRRAGTEYDSADIVDEATVLRILSGEVLHANAAERREVMRRWLAAGKSERSLCDRMGWKDGRYVTRDEAVA